MGTKEQHNKIDELIQLGYQWNKQMSASACGLIIQKNNDIWFFGLNGEIDHNPIGLNIIV